MSKDVRPAEVPSHHLHGEIRDAELCQPLSGVEVRLIRNGVPSETCLSNDAGNWRLQHGGEGEVEFSKAGFQSKRFSAGEIPPMTRLLSDRLIGYHDRLWFLPGESIAARIHSVSPYRATLFRHGLTKQPVLELGEFPPSIQQVPDGVFVERGIAWNATINYQIPNAAEPGIYSLLLESLVDSSARFAIPMVVSTPPARRGNPRKLLVLASTSTWQSYNIWGGRSRYRNFEAGAAIGFNVMAPRRTATDALKALVPAPLWNLLRKSKAMLRGAASPSRAESAWQHERLSIRRPYTNCSLEGEDPYEPFTNHLAAGEWRVLAWLEREGVSYDIVAGYELHAEPALLKSYRAILLSTHCEYWTREMYEGLHRAHFERGLWVLNLSGNSIYRQIDFHADGSSHCVSLSFEKDCADETEILGVRFDMTDYASCAPYAIAQPDHELFAGCPMPADGIMGRESLNRHTTYTGPHYDPGRPGSGQAGSPFALHGSGASGWETDKCPPTRVSEFQVLAKGLNQDGGADMIYRDADGARGGMFSASSLTFGGALLVDPVLSRLTSNVIRKAVGGSAADRGSEHSD